MTEATGSEQSQGAPRERVIDLSVEVEGSPEEVWAAIATGPGISAWYVPTTVQERPGGATTSAFGEGDELQIPGRVVAWEPPHRVMFAGAGDGPGLAFEWLVEARDKGTCVVRLVNSGFVEGTPWDDEYDAMTQGWLLFLTNLRLHLAHFAGRAAVSSLPSAPWPVSVEEGWARLTSSLGLPLAAAPGDRVSVSAQDAPPMAGTVMAAGPGRLALLLDEPSPGTAFLAAERMGEACGVSVWQYLYGDDAPQLAPREYARWTSWLQATTPS